MEFTTIDRVFNRLAREWPDEDFNESDVIEWIGEAIAFGTVHQITEEAIAFIEIENHQGILPNFLKHLIMVVRDNDFVKYDPKAICDTVAELEENSEQEVKNFVLLDCNGMPIFDYDIAYYRPYFDMKYNYDFGRRYFRGGGRFTPVRLANHAFFKTVVCPELDDMYSQCRDEYTIDQTSGIIRTSFKEGRIVVSYTRPRMDSETGYPLVPDNVSYITAISYYVSFKIAERESRRGRQGYAEERDRSEKRYLKYIRQAKNYAKMPKTVDEFENLKDGSLYRLPKGTGYNNFFGNISHAENMRYLNPR